VQRSGGAGHLLYVEAETAPARGGPGPARPAAGSDADSDGRAAVTDLFRVHHLELVRLAVLMTGDQGTAEDIVQDVFERLHRGWPRLREPGRGLAYARASVVNGCRMAHRHSAVARRYAPRLARADPACPDAAAALADESEMIAALRALPRRQREVLVLRYYADLDVAEIAATLRIGASAVRSTMSRGLATLARALEGEQR
jgi:RNA polymerase sigma-70 factor (sigma-E family)